MKRRRPTAAEMHPCAAASCPKRCQRKHLMCWVHWCCVPRALQARIYQTCAAGMGADYQAAVAEAVELVARRDARRAGLII